MAGNSLMVYPGGLNTPDLTKFGGFDDLMANPYSGGYAGNSALFNYGGGTLPFTGGAMPFLGYDPKLMTDYQASYRSANAEYATPEEGVALRIQDLVRSIEKNSQGDIGRYWDRYIADVRTLYPNLPQDQLNARARAMYQRQTGVDIASHIDTISGGAFGDGFSKGASFAWVVNGTSSSDNLYKITGEKSQGASVKEGLGMAAGGALTAGTTILGVKAGAAAGAALGTVVPGLGNAVGAIIGGIVGGALGFFAPRLLVK